MLDMIEPGPIATAAIVGLLLGGVYFGGLWWTVCRIPRTQHPLNFYFGSLVIRLAVVIAALYLVLTCFGWPELVAALVGFSVTRLILIRLLGEVSQTAVLPQEAV